jgi:hypothetical protein
MFRMEHKDWRREPDGKIVQWVKAKAKPRLQGAPSDYIPKETEAAQENLQLAIKAEGAMASGEPDLGSDATTWDG